MTLGEVKRILDLDIAAHGEAAVCVVFVCADEAALEADPKLRFAFATLRKHADVVVERALGRRP